MEAAIRLGCFAGVLLLMAILESVAPCRQRSANTAVRWSSNLGLSVLNIVATRLLVPLGLTGIAMAVQRKGWGILNLISLPTWADVLIAVIVLDFVIYLQHVLFHFVPALWRLHMVHHADLDFDVTTGVRFHTIEILVSLGIKSAAVVILALGVPNPTLIA